ncbi:helix-turn-helix domain-containing protein [Dokdonia sp.]|uniref:helix-turn-helix domain-containing protein n=1 Tax=Dokdonia sp. TaxID=2024995 RepID=UPI003264C3AF
MRLEQCVLPLILYFFFPIFVYAQEPILEGYTPIDSLKDKDYKVFIDHFNRTAPDYEIEPDSLFAHEIAMTYLWKAHSVNDTLNMGKAYGLLGQLEGLRFDYLDKAIAYTENYNDKFQPAVAYLLKFQSFYYTGNYKKAMKLLFTALEYTERNKNDYLSYYVRKDINALRADWGDKKHAIEEYKKELSFIYLVKFDTIRYPTFSKKNKELKYVTAQYQLAQTNYELNELKNASIYIDSVYQFGITNNLDEYKIQYYGLKGGILYREKRYLEALDFTNKFLELENPEDFYAISRSSVIKGLTLWELNRKEEAIHSIKKADSLYQISDDEFEELGEGYQLLINHYKEIEDTENQLLYLNKLIAFDKKISSNYLEIGNRITQEYTVPQLLAEKDIVISKLNVEKASEKRSKYIVFIFLGISGIVILYYISAHYRSKKKFSALQQDFEQRETSQVKEEVSLAIAPKSLGLDDAQIALISKGLEKFEQSQGYLEAAVTLKSLAQSMHTNSSYLSKYINAVQGANFSQYMSTLRVQYAIYKLQEDAKFRSYTIEAVASEVGFSNTRSFTNHFKRVTGITVSYFIKKLPSS